MCLPLSVSGITESCAGIFGKFVDEHGFGQGTVLYIFGVISLWIFEKKCS